MQQPLTRCHIQPRLFEMCPRATLCAAGAPPAQLAAASDAAAAALAADGPAWLGPYALTGAAGEAAAAFSREARAARRRERVGAKQYLLDPEPLEMRMWHAKVRTHACARAHVLLFGTVGALRRSERGRNAQGCLSRPREGRTPEHGCAVWRCSAPLDPHNTH
jgi:hypothetical protein